MREKLTHTPGPWKIGKSKLESFDTAIHHEKNTKIICHVSKWEEAEANARLIATAPELKDDLIDAYKRFIEYQMDAETDPPHNHIETMNKYKSTLEKATGLKIDEILK